MPRNCKFRLSGWLSCRTGRGLCRRGSHFLKDWDIVSWQRRSVFATPPAGKISGQSPCNLGAGTPQSQDKHPAVSRQAIHNLEAGTPQYRGSHSAMSRQANQNIEAGIPQSRGRHPKMSRQSSQNCRGMHPVISRQSSRNATAVTLQYRGSPPQYRGK